MLESVLPFTLTSLVVELTPGPNMGYLAVLGIERGRTAGLAAVAGVALGLLVLGLLAGFGLGSVISETRWLYEMLRWGGVAYLLWLAWDSYREAAQPPEQQDAAASLPGYFRRGLVTNLLNPKAVVFYIAVLPNFVVAGAPVAQQALLLTLIYVVVATAVHAGIVLLSSALQPLLASERLRRYMGLVFALLLAGIAVWVAFATRRSW